MQFQSTSFILFLIIMFLLYWKIPFKYRWGLLLAAGYFFYSSWNVHYALILLGVTVVAYFAALGMGRAGNRKFLLWLFVIFETGVLILFKYTGFLAETIEKVFRLSGSSAGFPVLQLLLPVGISFYIFQTIAYVADVYHGKIDAEGHFGYFAASVAFFPVLLAGPIERVQNLLRQLKEEREFSEKLGWMAFQRIFAGYMKKVIIADSLAVFVNRVYGNLEGNTGFPLLLAMALYSIEIYCDFSGYSDIAIGVAGLFGIELRANFEQPYLADSVRNFWKRWHISLTSWFRDYIYIPLGGNRVSRARHYGNIMITFLLSGLWHGASWNFVFWGALHGMLQILENTLNKFYRTSRVAAGLRRVCTFILISIAWVFFRADKITDAWFVLTHCFIGAGEAHDYIMNGFEALDMSYLQAGLLLFFIILQAGMDVCIEYKRRREITSPVIIGIVVIALFYFFRYGTDAGTFIYFQF